MLMLEIPSAKIDMFKPPQKTYFPFQEAATAPCPSAESIAFIRSKAIRF